MKRILKVLAGLVGAVVLLLVLAAVILPLVYDKEDIKAAISSEVQNRTGRQLSISGALDFSVFPWLAVEVGDLELSNAEGFGDQPFAEIGQARVGVALMPLLSKQISVDEITLDDLVLSLQVKPDGTNNWQDLAEGEESGAAAESESGMFSGGRVAGLNIRDASVEYRDQQSGSHYLLSGFTLQTGALGDSSPLPLELAALLEDRVAGTKSAVELKTTATIDLAARRHRLEDLELVLAPTAGGQNQAVRLLAPRADVDLTAQTLQLESFSAQLAGLQVDGAISAQSILDAPVFSGSLQSGVFSPADLMKSLDIEAPVTADPGVLQHGSFSMKLSGDSGRVALGDFVMELDQSRFTGELSVNDFDRPKINFDLAVDKIDLDRYLEPAAETGSAQADDVAMPRDELRGQEVTGRLKAGNLRLAGLEFNEAEVSVSIRGGKLRLNPLEADFYGGRYSGDIGLDGSGNVPVLSLDEKIDGITFQRLVADLVENESLSGLAQGHARLTGRGHNSSDVLGNLAGDLGLTLDEGALEGINIWYEIRRGLALYKGLPAPEPEPNRTVFSRLHMAAGVDDGVVTTRELTGELPFLSVRGNGTIDLARSQVDLGMVAEVRDVPELAGDPTGAELAGKRLPFRVTGTLDDPSVSLDWEALLKSEATEMLLDKLGLVPKARQTQDGQAQDGQAEDEETEASSEDQMKEAAGSLLLDLLKPKEKDKDGG